MSQPHGTVANRYHIIEKLCQGGIGVVYKAQDRLTQSVVVLKQAPSPSVTSSLPRASVASPTRPTASPLPMSSAPDETLSILKSIVPEIEVLLGRSISDAPALTGQAATERIALAIAA